MRIFGNMLVCVRQHPYLGFVTWGGGQRQFQVKYLSVVIFYCCLFVPVAPPAASQGGGGSVTMFGSGNLYIIYIQAPASEKATI